MDTVNSTSPYAEVFSKIGYYRANSNDISFHQYLDQALSDAERGTKTPADLLKELDYNYSRYLSYVNNGNKEPAGNVVNEDYIKNYEKNQEKRTQIEIKVGAGILSVVGALFVLVALVYFGTLYLDDYFKGIALFAAGGILILVSETIIARRLPHFSRVITGLGFGVLYFAAMYSYLSLDMYDVYVCLATILGIAILNTIVARLRKSPIIEIVCALGSAVPAVFYDGEVDNIYFAVLVGLALIVNLILFIAPYKEGFAISKIIRLCVVFAVIIAANFKFYWMVDYYYFGAAVVFAMLVMFTAYVFNTRNMVIKSVALTFIGLLSCLVCDEIDWYVFAGVGVVCVIAALCLLRKKEVWAPLSVFLLYAVLFVYANGAFSSFRKDSLDEMIAVLILLTVLVVSKLCAFSKNFALTDAIITFFALFGAVLLRDNYLSFAILFVAFLGVIMCVKYKLYHEFMYAAMMTLFVFVYDFDYLTLPIMMAAMFILLLTYNLIPTMRVKGIVAFNIIAIMFIASEIALIPMMDFEGLEEIIVVSSAALIAILTSLIVFRKPFGLETKSRYIIMAATLTYIALTMNVEPLWISISLMAVAFVTIAIGCIANRFDARIYGLVLSLLVCAKVALVDFKDQSDFNRMVVFLVVGLLAIAISFVYLILESREQKQAKALKAQAQAAQAPQVVPGAFSPINVTYQPTPAAYEPVNNVFNEPENSVSNDSLPQEEYNKESVEASAEEPIPEPVEVYAEEPAPESVENVTTEVNDNNAE